LLSRNLVVTENETSVVRLDQNSDNLSTRTLSWHSSDRNTFGFIRSYYCLGPVISDHDADASFVHPDEHQTTIPLLLPQLGPFDNLSSFELAEWFWTTAGVLSLNNFSRLVEILNGRDFSTADVASTNWRKVFHVLASNKDDLPAGEGEWIDDEGWYATDVRLDVPFHSRMKHSGTETYVAGKLHHRRIVAVIREALSNPARSRRFHFKPYKLIWRRHPSAADINVQGELYNSSAFLQAHMELQNSPPEPGCNLERVVVALMFWSDETLLTSFGGSKLWPCYMYFGNESKLRRVKGSEHLGEHIAYFEEVSLLHWL
jgi:Plavaka transposase